MAIFYPVEADINSTIASAQPHDIVYLPAAVLKTKIIIRNSCIIMGQGMNSVSRTTIDLADSDQTTQTVKSCIDAKNCKFSLSNISIVNKQLLDHWGLYFENCSVDLSECSGSAFNSLILKGCFDSTIDSVNFDGGAEAVRFLDCRSITTTNSEFYLAGTALSIEGTSNVIGDVTQTSNVYWEGTYTPNTTYSASILIDNNAYTTPKLIEKYTTVLTETSNDIPSQNPLQYSNQVLKIAKNLQVDKIFDMNLRYTVTEAINNVVILTSFEFSGHGAVDAAGALSATLNLIKKNNMLQTNPQDNIILTGTKNGSAYSGTYVLQRLYNPGNLQPGLYTFNGSFNLTLSETLFQQYSFEDPVVVDVTSPPPVFGGSGNWSQTQISDAINQNLINTPYAGSIVVNIDANGKLIPTSNVSPNPGYRSYLSATDVQGRPSLMNLVTNTQIDVKDLDRRDRTTSLTFENCNFFKAQIGIMLANANNVTFDSCKIYECNSVGLLQFPNSYNNKFGGEIFGMPSFAVKNSDNQGDIHIIDATEVWWGSRSGPSGVGKGTGSKISKDVNYQSWLTSGTQPPLSYPGTRNFIWGQLGAPQVRVELTEEDVTRAISMAMDRYLYYMTPELDYYYFDGPNNGNQEYQLPLAIPKSAITEVVFQPQMDIIANMTGSGDSFLINMYMQRSGNTFLSDFYIAMAYKETMERTLALNPTYEFLSRVVNGQVREYIRVYPRPSQNVRLAVKYQRALTELETDANWWIKQYAETFAREKLGIVRGKFASMPGPTGEISMNGDAMVQQALTDREALLTQLISLGEPLSFTTG